MYTRGHLLPKRSQLSCNIKHTQLKSFSPSFTGSTSMVWLTSLCPEKAHSRTCDNDQTVITRLWIIADPRLWLRHLVPKSDWMTSGRPLNLTLSFCTEFSFFSSSSSAASSLLLCCFPLLSAVSLLYIVLAFIWKWIKTREKKQGEQDKWQSLCLICVSNTILVL